MRKLPRYRLCFVCGRDNAAGLDTQFYRDEEPGRVFAFWTPDEKHLGYRDRVHGGVVASILDETMGWAPAATARSLFYSAEINVRYRRPVPSGERLRVEGEVTEDRRRVVRTAGRLTDESGETVYATATGVYVPLPPGETEGVLRYLYIEGDEERDVTLDDL